MRKIVLTSSVNQLHCSDHFVPGVKQCPQSTELIDRSYFGLSFQLWYYKVCLDLLSEEDLKDNKCITYLRLSSF